MNKLKSRTIQYIIFGILGIILALVSGINGTSDTYWIGMGVGFVVISSIRLFQIYKYKNDDSYAEKINIQNNDERNRFLAEKARSMTFYYSIFFEAIAIIVLKLLDYSEVGSIIAFVICIQLGIYYLSYLWLKRKY